MAERRTLRKTVIAEEKHRLWKSIRRDRRLTSSEKLVASYLLDCYPVSPRQRILDIAEENVLSHATVERAIRRLADFGYFLVGKVGGRFNLYVPKLRRSGKSRGGSGR
jgi:DNA-binding MarR family transcriptional regulator